MRYVRLWTITTMNCFHTRVKTGISGKMTSKLDYLKQEIHVNSMLFTAEFEILHGIWPMMRSHFWIVLIMGAFVLSWTDQFFYSSLPYLFVNMVASNAAVSSKVFHIDIVMLFMPQLKNSYSISPCTKFPDTKIKNMKTSQTTVPWIQSWMDPVNTIFR